MKLFVLFALLCLFEANDEGTAVGDHELRIEISNIKKVQGQILVAIYDNEDQYLDTKNSFHAQAPVKKEGTMTISVEIPFGHYAIGMFHDLNGNGELDTNFMGVPSEPYGFSNGKKGTFGPPSFDRAKFEFKTEGQVHKIQL